MDVADVVMVEVEEGMRVRVGVGVGSRLGGEGGESDGEGG